MPDSSDTGSISAYSTGWHGNVLTRVCLSVKNSSSKTVTGAF